jgi:predicted nucleic acid-binding protein
VSSTVVVDTDAFSCLWQRKGNHAQIAQQLVGNIPTLSFTTVAEARFGAADAGWGQPRIAQLEEALRRYVIAPYDDQLPLFWGKLKAQAKRSGHALAAVAQTNDLWIATTAI